MANPQCENGYTKIANEILEALAKFQLPGREMRCLIVILRKTYGFNKKKADITLNEFAHYTKLLKPHICESLINLLLKSVIGITKNGNAPSTYWFNKDYTKWQQLPKSVIRVTENGNIPIKEKLKKKNIGAALPKTVTIAYPEWLNKKLWVDFKKHRQKLRAPMTEESEKRNILTLEKLTKQGHSQEDVIGQSIERGWKGLFELKAQENKRPGYKSVSEIVKERGY